MNLEKLEIELKEAKKTLKDEEYNLRWSGHVHPYDYIRYWRNKVEELENKIQKITTDFGSKKDLLD